MEKGCDWARENAMASPSKTQRAERGNLLASRQVWRGTSRGLWVINRGCGSEWKEGWLRLTPKGERLDLNDHAISGFGTSGFETQTGNLDLRWRHTSGFEADNMPCAQSLHSEGALLHLQRRRKFLISQEDTLLSFRTCGFEDKENLDFYFENPHHDSKHCGFKLRPRH